jgi:hypothetical protein
MGAICVLALIPLFSPRSWLDGGHKFLGLDEFAAAPIADYLARSVSALCVFYGGLLLLLAGDVRRFVSIIKCQGRRDHGLLRLESSQACVPVSRLTWWWPMLWAVGFFYCRSWFLQHA